MAMASSRSFRDDDCGGDDEVELQWAAIERLPTFKRIRTSLFDQKSINADKDDILGKKAIDVARIGAFERRVFMDQLITTIDKDNLKLLKRLKERMARVGLKLPTIEVKFDNLNVEAEYQVVHGKPQLPTLWNTVTNMFPDITKVNRSASRPNKIKILDDVSGIIKPSRMTLLLGLPGCGKTTLLQTLAGKHDPSLKVSGEISYNGCKFSEFVPQKTSAYINQYDLHIPDMTVRETIDFSARCQGIGSRADILKELSRREKLHGIIPEPDIDTYMKAISVEGLKRTLQTDYILKILGLDICADTTVGDAMNRGISGCEMKRLTIGEMMVGPTKALFMDEILTGLDSSTTFQIVTCLQQLAHTTGATFLISLLQPAPETFDLFHDIILMDQGKIIYQGPRTEVHNFFEYCGFKCPPRKGTAVFLQEVLSQKEQEQFWFHTDRPYSYVSTDKFIAACKEFHAGQGLNLNEELCKPFDKTEDQHNALSFDIYSLGKWELFKACLAREWSLTKRSSFLYVYRSAQLVLLASVTMTLFVRTRMKIDEFHSRKYMACLFFGLFRVLTSGVPELALTSSRLGVFYKQRDLYFHPAWAYSIPSAILRIPFSFLDTLLWTSLIYFGVGYSPEPERFFRQLFIQFLLHQVAISIFRLIAAVIRTLPVAAIFCQFTVMATLLFSGFIVPLPSMPSWIKWCFWISPLSYTDIGNSINEFLSPRWQKVSSLNVTLGHLALRRRGLNFEEYFYWRSVAALIGMWILVNVGFTLALSYLKSPGTGRPRVLSHTKRKEDLSNSMEENQLPGVHVTTEVTSMVLPSVPVTLSFENVHYFVDTPKKFREKVPNKKLHLLQDISGAFRPGVLTALMGASGAGKTTLMDVLSGRKTGGYIEGDIRVGGYPKVQKTYTRVSGYCEQTDIHSPRLTIKESVIYSAWLRLSAEVPMHKRLKFVEEVLQMIELDEIKDSLIGIRGFSGISAEQHKRLTIAVELVANPSIIFMDEPTSGLDARAAAIVMRAVKNIVSTKRTVVCTIHQPSIDIFEAFDEIILMKGGQIVYFGELGQNSCKLIEYFEGIPGVPKIKENDNPATWMLEVTNPSIEAELGVDFAHLYKQSSLYQRNKEQVQELRVPSHGSQELSFTTRFPQNRWEQFKACLWKQHLSYWRNPTYNLGRLILAMVSSLLYGALLWKKGQKLNNEQDLFNIMGSVYVFMVSTGASNLLSVLPIVNSQRTIVYRERFSGMYSSKAHSLAQVIVEIPYVFLEAALFLILSYPAVNLYASAYKVSWYFYDTFCTLLTYKYMGMAIASLSTTYQMAAINGSYCITVANLFSGFLIPQPKLPKWWNWFYWMVPTSWTLRGLITSQYGDINKEIIAFGERKTISAFLESHYGFKHKDLPITAILLFAYPIFFASVFIYCTAKLNFQRR
ncbi:ATP-binding cassette G33, pleiotropic drug resistance 5, PLEIOTROPIC DRUG RESISTANCE 5 [Hibiscus trionum]|uniref:ATP-binding cassette G33, pleiotropic drug resistance 5, PLEIOTROPIC DRUG RESISTANCE 5 n=1 Tax=Hibiscus trionum TaxID=183268 RepID=A0A9W7LQN7_HIBTR|nr:ATP-binding cassette G33, pleiotropic drug resistance 5, PLEIOTROPIC DRUG RESISTANCE 5 [Hibiscus trionum]